jgi:hypothetical protein
MDSQDRSAIMAEICERLAEGESLRTICADEHMPTKSKVFRWLAEDAAFADQYARAREAQADTLVDDIVTIADTEEDANRARVRIDARKWTAGKMRPKVYGDRVAIGGSDDMPAIKTEETGAGIAKLAAYLDAIRSRNPGDAPAE